MTIASSTPNNIEFDLDQMTLFVDTVRNQKIAEVDKLVSEFDELRKEYMSEIDKLRSFYGPQFVAILAQIQSNNKFISEVSDVNK